MAYDTFLVAFQRYEADLAAFEANPDAGENGEDTVDFTTRLLATAGNPPRISSAEGAALALRRVLADNVIIDTLDEKLVRGVLAFLEREAGR